LFKIEKSIRVRLPKQLGVTQLDVTQLDIAQVDVEQAQEKAKGKTPNAQRNPP